MTNTIDLHTHSTASDGLYSPTELLRLAHDAGLKTIGLVDHDTTMYLAPYGDTLGRDADLLPELLDVGSLPMVVTPMGTAARVAAEVHHCVQADRAVRVSYALTGGADLQPVWPGRIGVVSR